MKKGKYFYVEEAIRELVHEIDIRIEFSKRHNLNKNNAEHEDGEDNYTYSNDTLQIMKKGTKVLRVAAIYAKHLNLFLDEWVGEDEFKKQLKEDLEE